TVRFRVSLGMADKAQAHEHSVAVQQRQVACFVPQVTAGEARLLLERYGSGPQHLEGQVRLLAFENLAPLGQVTSSTAVNVVSDNGLNSPVVLLTNGRGGMARLCVNLGQIKSKYDCALGANLHSSVPVDRHIFVKRLRVWSVADGFITPLDDQNLFAFEAGPPACWRFVANAGDGR